jgi:small-conductance mechanosensitive channel
MNIPAREELRKLVTQLQETLDEATYERVAAVLSRVLDLRQRAWEGEQSVLRARLADVEHQRQAVDLERHTLAVERQAIEAEREALAKERAALAAAWEDLEAARGVQEGLGRE